MKPISNSTTCNATDDPMWLDTQEVLYSLPTTGLNRAAHLQLSVHREYVQAMVAEPRRQLDASSQHDVGATAEVILQRRFELHAQVNPGAPALRYGTKCVSYGELDAQADTLAAFIQQQDFVVGDVVGICVAPGHAWIRSTLAVLKAGGIYLLLDPALSDSQLHKLLLAAQARAVIVQADCSQRLPVHVRRIQSDDEAAGLPQHWPDEHARPAWATACLHVGADGLTVRTGDTLIANLHAVQQLLPLSQHDAVLHGAVPALGSFSWEMLWPLSHGAQLVLALAAELASTTLLRQLVARSRITVMHLSASALDQLLCNGDDNSLRSLRGIFYAGGPTQQRQLPSHGNLSL